MTHTRQQQEECHCIHNRVGAMLALFEHHTLTFRIHTLIFVSYPEHTVEAETSFSENFSLIQGEGEVILIKISSHYYMQADLL